MRFSLILPLPIIFPLTASRHVLFTWHCPVAHYRHATTQPALEKAIVFRQTSILAPPPLTQFQTRAHGCVTMTRTEIRIYVVMRVRRRLNYRNAGRRLLTVQSPSPSVPFNISTEMTYPAGWLPISVSALEFGCLERRWFGRRVFFYSRFQFQRRYDKDYKMVRGKVTDEMKKCCSTIAISRYLIHCIEFNPQLLKYSPHRQHLGHSGV